MTRILWSGDMTCFKRIVGAAMLVSAGLSAPAAQANYIVTLTQRGSDVVETGNGSLDLTALTFAFPHTEEGRVDASVGLVVLGPTGSSTPHRRLHRADWTKQLR